MSDTQKVTTATVPLPYAYMNEKGTVYVVLCNGEAWSYRDGEWTKFEDEKDNA